MFALFSLLYARSFPKVCLIRTQELHKNDQPQPWGGVLWSLRRVGNGEMSVTPTNTHGANHPHLAHDPEEYQRAKRRLKKAVLEFYR
jgi:hypothetical protein